MGVQQSQLTGIDTSNNYKFVFRVIRLLGKGPTGSVYMCKDMVSRTRKSVKCIPLETTNDVQLARNFFNSLEHLRHVNIISVDSVIKSMNSNDPSLYITSDIHDHGDLTVLIQSSIESQTKVHTRYVMSIMNQISNALSYIHENGHTHGNLKLQNIIITEISDHINIAVRDFALPKHIKVKQDTVIKGANDHLAPEVSLKAPDVLPSGDIWSLGVVIAQVMTPTIRGGIRRDIQMKGESKLHAKLRKQIMRGEEYQSELVDLVLQMLSVSPESRPTAQQVHERGVALLMEYKRNESKHEKKRIYIQIRNGLGLPTTQKDAETYIKFIIMTDDRYLLSDVLVWMQETLLGEHGPLFSQQLEELNLYQTLEKLLDDPNMKNLAVQVYGHALFMDRRFFSEKFSPETPIALAFLLNHLPRADLTFQLACVALRGWQRHFSRKFTATAILSCTEWYIWLLNYLGPSMMTDFADDMLQVIASVICTIIFQGLISVEGCGTVIDDVIYYLNRLADQAVITDFLRCEIQFCILSQIADKYLDDIKRANFSIGVLGTKFINLHNLVLFLHTVEEFTTFNNFKEISVIRLSELALRAVTIICELKQHNMIQYPSEIVHLSENRLLDTGMRRMFLRLVRYVLNNSTEIGIDLKFLDYVYNIVRCDFDQLGKSDPMYQYIGSMSLPEPYDNNSTLLWIMAMLFEDFRRSFFRKDFERASAIMSGIQNHIFTLPTAKAFISTKLRNRDSSPFLTDYCPLVADSFVAKDIETMLESETWTYVWQLHFSSKLDQVRRAESKFAAKIDRYRETVKARVLKNIQKSEKVDTGGLAIRLDSTLF
jgi:serine/threonine protein kinase